MPSSFLPISTLPEIAKCIDGAERILKADIARMKKLLADRAACPPQLPKSLFRKQKSPSTGLAEAESIREAVVVDTSRAIQNAIDELLSSGFHRAELSLLAREADVVSKLGHKYRKASELGDDPSVPRAAYVSTEAIGDSQGAVTGTLVYVRAGLLMGPVAGRTLAAIAAAAALGGGAGEASWSMVGSTAKLRVAKAELEAEPKAAAEEEVRRRAEASACGRPQEEWLCAQAAE